MNRFFRRAAYVGGSWIQSSTGRVIGVTNPANGESVGEVPELTSQDCEVAINSSSVAFESWRKLEASRRSDYLRSIASCIRSNLAYLAIVLTTEQGKPIKEAERELLIGADYFDWFSEEAKRVYGETFPSLSSSKKILIDKEPIGVCAAITPWNFPHAMIARKMAAALAAGCTFIVKPAPETPFSALALAAICEEVGLPDGVFNVVTGDAETIAKSFMSSREIRKITFTGSTEVGKLLMSQAAQTVKRVTLELGGNAPFVVFDDADLDLAVSESIFAKFRNGGQTCICANRFLLHSNIAQKFTDKFLESVKRLTVGDGKNADVDIGPMINQESIQKINSLISDAITKGASLLYGKPPKGQSLYVEPVVISGVNESMRIWHEEIFGPVAVFRTFRSEDEAIRLANDTNYGLVAYLFTQDLNRAFRVSKSLEFGMIGINDSKVSTPEAPFGGIKESGFGREGGHQGLDEYLNLKYISLGN